VRREAAQTGARGVLATALVLGILSGFRWIEVRMPTQSFANHTIRFARAHVMPEAELRKLLDRIGFSIADLSFRLSDGGRFFEYRMILRTKDRG
jgi:putative Mg2+ transporter-C (MgtC) family protein